MANGLDFRYSQKHNGPIPYVTDWDVNSVLQRQGKKVEIIFLAKKKKVSRNVELTRVYSLKIKPTQNEYVYQLLVGFLFLIN